MPVLPLRIHHDGLLSVVAPLGAAASVGTAVVIDLAPTAPPLRGGRTVADLVDEGPSADDLRPRPGRVAVLPLGAADPTDAQPVVEALARTWPFVVVRTETGAAVDVAPLFGPDTPAWVHQPTGFVPIPKGLAGIVLPSLPVRTVRALLAGRSAKGPWVSAWQGVWRSL